MKGVGWGKRPKAELGSVQMVYPFILKSKVKVFPMDETNPVLELSF